MFANRLHRRELTMPCRCQSLSVYVKSIKIEKATDTGSGFPEKVLNTFSDEDDVSFVAVSQGVKLTHPPGGRAAWPDDGSWSARKGDIVPNDAIRVATVEPFGDSCSVELNTFVQFYEKDWDDLQDLLEQAVAQGVQAGLIATPPQYGGFISTLGKGITDVFKTILDGVTGLRSEAMGEVVIRLAPCQLDAPIKLCDFPWGQELDRTKMRDKEADSFSYVTTLSRWGGKWEVTLLFDRRCSTPTVVPVTHVPAEVPPAHPHGHLPPVPPGN